MKKTHLESCQATLNDILKTVEETDFMTELQDQAIENLEFEIDRISRELDDEDFDNDFELNEDW